jgi:hypothetical protein
MWWTFDSHRNCLVTSMCKIFVCQHIESCSYQSKRRFVTEDHNSIHAVVRNLGQSSWHSWCSDQNYGVLGQGFESRISLRGRLLYCKLRNTVADWGQLTAAFAVCPSCLFQKYKATIKASSIRGLDGLCRLHPAVCGGSRLYIAVMRDPYGSRMWQVRKRG